MVSRIPSFLGRKISMYNRYVNTVLYHIVFFHTTTYHTIIYQTIQYAPYYTTAEASKLEYDCPPSPNQRKKEHQPKSSHINIPTVWSLPYKDPYVYMVQHIMLKDTML